MTSKTHSSSNTHLVGVDVGGTKVTAVVIDNKFNILAELTRPTDLTSPKSTLQGIAEVIKDTVHKAGLLLSNIAAAGLGIPGQVNPESGIVNLAVNLNWQEQPAGPWLSKNLGLPSALENDVRTATLGIYQLEKSAVNSMAYVSIGTGIAAGIIINSRLYRGSAGMAGEIGHAIIDPAGARCKCGAFGCLEALVAGPAIATQAEQALQKGKLSAIGSYSHQPITAKAVYRAAEKEDDTAKEIIAKAGYYLGLALYNLIMSYDVESIVLGGGVSKAGDVFLQSILNGWEQLRQQSPLARKMLQPNMLSLAPAQVNYGALGGAILAQQKIVLNHKGGDAAQASSIFF